jgi:hypothetical protein
LYKIQSAQKYPVGIESVVAGQPDGFGTHQTPIVPFGRRWWWWWWNFDDFQFQFFIIRWWRWFVVFVLFRFFIVGRSFVFLIGQQSRDGWIEQRQHLVGGRTVDRFQSAVVQFVNDRHQHAGLIITNAQHSHCQSTFRQQVKIPFHLLSLLFFEILGLFPL